MVLYLEWAPHGRIDGAMPAVDGRIPAQELRALFRKFRRLRSADLLHPPNRPGTLPEMACFIPSSHIHHKMGEREQGEDDVATHGRLNHYHHCHYLFQTSRKRRFTMYRSLRGCSEISPSGASDARPVSPLNVLGVSYRKSIIICQKIALMKPAIQLVPSDHWLHAMDSCTYQHHQAIQFRPQCRYKSCANYYKRTKDYYFCRLTCERSASR